MVLCKILTNPCLVVSKSCWEINCSMHDIHSIEPVRIHSLRNVIHPIMIQKKEMPEPSLIITSYYTLTFPVVTQERNAWTICSSQSKLREDASSACNCSSLWSSGPIVIWIDLERFPKPLTAFALTWTTYQTKTIYKIEQKINL